jgi:hypothetical protein
MALQQNMGEQDRTVRLVVATVLIIVSFIVSSGALKILLSLLALVLVATSWFRFCPAYIPFKIDTRNKG